MSKFDVPISVVSYSQIKHIKSAVYVLGNQHMNCYKIGFVDRIGGSIQDRINEMTRSQWVVPGSIRCLLIVETDNPRLLEHKMHNDPNLKKSRINDKRELFKADINKIYSELKNHSSGISSHIYIIREDAEIFGLKYQELNEIKFPKTTQDNSRLQSGLYYHKNGIYVEYNYEMDKWRLIENDSQFEWLSFSSFATIKGCQLRSQNYSYDSHKDIFIRSLTLVK